MRNLNEADTCRQLIDPKLRGVGWDDPPRVVRREHIFIDGRLRVEGGRDQFKRADYLLGMRRDLTLAVVEAKKESDLAGEGLSQAIEYASILGLRFAYSTNGHEIVERDMVTGAQREITEFPAPVVLWSRVQDSALLSDKTAGPLLTPGHALSGRSLRYYQERAVCSVLTAIARGRTRVLLIMATGTGKTEVAFQICWRLWQSRWNAKGEHRKPRVLFLADRNILVDDPKDKTFGPFGDVRCKIEGGAAPKGREMHFALYQSLVGDGSGAALFQRYPRDYFDLIIVDECHRGSASEASLWRSVLEWFESAVQLGMTATPVSGDGAESYAYFGEPVYTYSLRQGIDDGFLAPYRVYRFTTDWDAEGWRPTPGELDLFGRLIPEQSYQTADFERAVTLKARTEAIARGITSFLDRTDPSAKTLVFCVDQQHALAMRDALARLNPERIKKHPDWVCRVTSDEGDLGRGHLSHFQDPERSAPQVLTTSQMLTTGVDAPDCRNIVLLRMVGSMVEFKQIIGRGTRLCEAYGKRFFNILDFTDTVTARFNDPAFDGEPVSLNVVPFGPDGLPTEADSYIPRPTRVARAQASKVGVHGDGESEVGAAGDAPTGLLFADGGAGDVHLLEALERNSEGELVEQLPMDFEATVWVQRRYEDAVALHGEWSDPEGREVMVAELKSKGAKPCGRCVLWLNTGSPSRRTSHRCALRSSSGHFAGSCSSPSRA